MTEAEVFEIVNWVRTCRDAQPEGSLLIFAYVRDGRVQLHTQENEDGITDAGILKSFPTMDLPLVRNLVLNGLGKQILKRCSVTNPEVLDSENALLTTAAETTKTWNRYLSEEDHDKT